MSPESRDICRRSGRRLLVLSWFHFETFVLKEGQYVNKLNMYDLNTSSSDQKLDALFDKSLVEIIYISTGFSAALI